MRNIISVLFATALVVTASVPSAEQYRVSGLEQFGATDEMYSGHMPLSLTDNKQGSLFFWLANHRASENNENASGADKLVIWLNGGPGCSSMIGMMHENGPFTIEVAPPEPIDLNASAPPSVKYNLKKNPFAWNRVANILYVEQPIRTGFSLAAKGAGPTTDEEELAADFRNFLLSFVEVFPKYKGAELFISGESYAGFFIPWIAEHIVKSQLVPDKEGNMVRDKTIDDLNLSGVAIGNGVMDMIFQEASYAEYAYYHGLIPLGAKLKFDREWTQCLMAIEQSGEPMTRSSFDRCDMMTKVLTAAGLPNEFNTATFRNYDTIVGPDSAFNMFFQDPSIQEMLHVRGYDLPGINFEVEGLRTVVNEQGRTYYEPPIPWGACNNAVDDSMADDHPVTVVPQLQFLTQVTASKEPLYSNSAGKGVSGKGGKSSGGENSGDKSSKDRKTLRRGRSTDTTTTTTTVSSDSSNDAALTTTTAATTAATTTAATTTTMDPLSHAIRVLLYSGEFDLNCNTLGTLHTLEANRWRNKPWARAERSLWKFADDVAGEYFTMDDVFSFLIVRNSGHLMPMDLPAISFNLIDRFVNSRSFADVPLPSEHSYTEDGDGFDLLSASPNPSTTSASAVRNSSAMLVVVVGLLLGAVYYVKVHGSHGGKTVLASFFGPHHGRHSSDTHNYVEIPTMDNSANPEGIMGADDVFDSVVSGEVTGAVVSTERFP